MTDDDVRLERLAWGALMSGVSTTIPEPWVHDALARGVESVCLFADAVGTPARVAASVLALRRTAPDVLVATDEEGGEVTRLESEAGSSFLSARGLGIIDDPDVTAAQARLLGQLLRATGVDWTLAPVADVNVDPRNPVIGVRSFGPDPARAGAHVAASVAGLQAAGVIATPKHFPGHGDTHVDSHEGLPTLAVDRTTLDSRELVPFRAAIAAHAASVMTGHLLVPEIDGAAPASLSAATTTGLLRHRLGFTGVVVTDAVEMGAVSGPGRARLAASVVDALLAGADVVCIGAADQERATADSAAAVIAAARAGVLTIELLEAAAARRRTMASVRSASLEPQDLVRDIDLLAAGAPRSLLVEGAARVEGDVVDVLTVSARPGYAAGPTGWRLAPRLVARGLDVHPVDEAPPFGRRPLVVEVRDAWKSPELLTALDTALRRRPDAVVVDVGWPTDLPTHTGGRIVTHGTGGLSAALATCVLTGTDPAATARALITDCLGVTA